jgi:hypothetical protein
VIHEGDPVLRAIRGDSPDVHGRERVTDGEREARDRSSIEDMLALARRLSLPFAVRVTRALARAGDDEGGRAGALLARRALDSLRRLEATSITEGD